MWSCKKNLKHFKFWKYFYWKHDKATLSVKAKFQIFQLKVNVTLSGLFTVPCFCRSFGINLSMGDNTCLR